MENKNIKYKHYEGHDDLDVQYEFWMEITKDLPWAWKPTRSPTQFMSEFNKSKEKTRYFAYFNGELLAYQSFTGVGNFVSFGYPWIKKEGLTTQEIIAVQDKLWDQIFNYAIGEYGGKTLLQRFRKDWEEQIMFFTNRGFKIVKSEPILIRDLRDDELTKKIEKSIKLDLEGFETSFEPNFSIGTFIDIYSKSNKISDEASAGIGMYYDSVNFDWSLLVKRFNEKIGYFGVTVRSDTKYCEIVSFVIDPEYNNLLPACLDLVAKKAKSEGVTHISLTTSTEDKLIPLYEKAGLSERSADVYVQYLNE